MENFESLKFYLRNRFPILKKCLSVKRTLFINRNKKRWKMIKDFIIDLRLKKKKKLL